MPKTDDAWLRKFSPKMRAQLQGRLDAMRAKSVARSVCRANYNGRAERWAVQASLRVVLRQRTGRKWAVVLKRTPKDADYTITFREQWRRLPTSAQKERLAVLLGKSWQGDHLRLSMAEAQAFLAATAESGRH